MMELNPAYLAFLEGLNEVDKAQLLFGNWDARAKGANYWERGWLKMTTSDKLPTNMVTCRPYDLAATERSQAVKFPDPTACIKVQKDRSGYLYISGDYHKFFYDDLFNIYGQFCKRSGDRDNHIILQAETDGQDCTIVLPIDPGAAGKTAYESMAIKFTHEGFKVKSDPTPVNKSKLTRFQPFASMCENGLVFWVEDSFDVNTTEFIFKQLEAFDGERSTTHRKDEFPDVLASGTNFLMKAKVRQPMSAGTATATVLAQYRNNS